MFVDVPDETNLIENLDSIQCHTGRFVLTPEKLVLAALHLDPSRQSWIFWMVHWNIAIPMLITILLELFQALVPGGGMRVPYEADVLELPDARISH